MDFSESNPQHQILTIHRIIGVCAKNLEAILLFIDFSKAFDSIHRGKIEQIFLVYSLPKETVTAIVILYTNRKVKVRSLEGDTNIFDIVARGRHKHLWYCRKRKTQTSFDIVARGRHKHLWYCRKRKTQTSFDIVARGRHKHLWYCRKRKTQTSSDIVARGSITLIYFHNLPSLRTLYVERSNKKDKKQTIPCRNYYRRRLHRWRSASCKYIYPSRIHST